MRCRALPAQFCPPAVCGAGCFLPVEHTFWPPPTAALPQGPWSCLGGTSCWWMFRAFRSPSTGALCALGVRVPAVHCQPCAEGVPTACPRLPRRCRLTCRQRRLHKRNLELLQRPEYDTLDWSFACPGVMTEPTGPSDAPAVPARVTVDELPARLPPWAALLPAPLLLPAVAAIKQQLVGPSYDQVAAAMVQHLAPNGPLRHRRVGFAAAA